MLLCAAAVLLSAFAAAGCGVEPLAVAAVATGSASWCFVLLVAWLLLPTSTSSCSCSVAQTSKAFAVALWQFCWPASTGCCCSCNSALWGSCMHVPEPPCGLHSPCCCRSCCLSCGCRSWGSGCWSCCPPCTSLLAPACSGLEVLCAGMLLPPAGMLSLPGACAGALQAAVAPLVFCMRAAHFDTGGLLLLLPHPKLVGVSSPGAAAAAGW